MRFRFIVSALHSVLRSLSFKVWLAIVTLITGLHFPVLTAGSGDTAAVRKAEDRCEVRSLTDVTYYKGDKTTARYHKLDLFIPKNRKDYPVVVFFHGGAWMYGDKSSFGRYTAVGNFLAEHGIGVVLPNYRLSPRVRHPEHVKDAARAFAWTYKNIAQYGGSPERLMVGGHSAGGHLASLLATDPAYLKAEGIDPKVVRGVLTIGGVYRIPDQVGLRLPGMLAMGGIKVIALGFNPFNLVFGADPQVRKAASPVTHVCPGLPPFLVLYADHELPLLSDMAEEFAGALQTAKCQVQLLKIKDRNHTSILFRATTIDDPAAQAILPFIGKHTGPKP